MARVDGSLLILERNRSWTIGGILAIICGLFNF